MRHERFYCGGKTPSERPYHYKECGLDNIYLMNGYDIEEVDGEQYARIHNIDGLWKAIGISLVTKQKLLSPKEIRFLRGQMDLTQAEVAGLLRVEDQTVARWEKGKSRLSGGADVAFRGLFLASDVAQPEGAKILVRWVDTIMRLIERDAPANDQIMFEQHDETWELSRRYA